MGAAAEAPLAGSADPRANLLYAEERHSLSFGAVWRLLVKFWPFIAPHWRLLALKCLLAVTSLTFFLLTPWPIKLVIDNVIDGRPLTGAPRALLYPLIGDDRALLLAVVSGYLALAAILIGIVGDRPSLLDVRLSSGGLDQPGFASDDANDGWSLWNGLFGLLEVWVTLDLTQRINQTLRTAIYERFLRSPLKLYDDQKIGDAVFRVMYDSSTIGPVLYWGFLSPLLSIITVLLALAIVIAQFRDQPIILVLAALALPVFAIGGGLFSRPFRNQNQQMHERGSNVMAAFEERIAQVQVIKAFGQEERERAAIDAASWASYRATLRLLVLIMLGMLVLAPAIGLLMGRGLYFLMSQVIAGKLTLGDVTLLVSYGFLLGLPMATLGATWALVQFYVSGLRRVHSVLERLGEKQSDGANGPLPHPIRELAFRDVSVGHPPAAPVLHNVTMTLRAGELTALAGASGCGKSTLLSSIPGFIEPCAGGLLLNGADARQFPCAAIRARLGFVFQHEALFSMTIADNIRYGNPSATDRELAAAAAMAGVAEFVERLPDGYATMLGRRGARLSVGQKQRIAIARALLRNPDALILDEPTAPLDADSEANLMRTLRRLAADRIVLLVAHRPETLAACDVVNFIDGGTLAASGPHEELLKSSPAYRRYLTPS